MVGMRLWGGVPSGVKSEQTARWPLTALVIALALSAPGSVAASDRNALVSIAERVTHVVSRGETLGAIMARYGVGPGEVNRWWRAARPTRDLSKLAVGHEIELSFTAENRLVSLGYVIDDDERLIVERDRQEGSFRTRVVEQNVFVTPVGARGRVETTFYEAARQSGIPAAVISEMVDVLSVRLDFGSRVRPGDRFRVLYEGRQDDLGRHLAPGRILAAEYHGAHQSVSVFLYEGDSGHTTYVDGNGRRLDDSFLRYPLEFVKITSTFSHSRFHPILKRRKPHLGVDFAAPTGTPVRAIGAGTVHWSAWKGAFGRHVEVDHGGKMISAYSHLSRIHPSVKKGGDVQRGQVIGWVGRSGRATGPHLHFAVFENGRYVNPLKTRRSAPAVAKVDPGRFASQREALTSQLRAVTTHHKPRRSAQALPLSALTQADHLKPGALTF